MTDYSHLHVDFKPVLMLSDKERIRFMGEPRWIGYQAAHNILDTLESLLDAPKRPRMPNLLIVGDSNNGKTTIVRHFVKNHGEGYIDEHSEAVRPVILAQAPPSADEKDLYAAILETFWMPYRRTDSKLVLRYQVIHTMRELKVRMLIIDEIHSMLTGAVSTEAHADDDLQRLELIRDRGVAVNFDDFFD
ncbi:Transposition helper protein [Pseudomonas savastanoi pv. phaseolicola]|uniref:Transposition helper protein n=1 Tax=Pseudomonas savastanoi pv. phaseolicola TaxID=319 RepID=A0ABD4BGY5_PSESH|nr:Transposition helper protein [Pseudomonas savastanoi pv. phaseolicola]